MARKTTHNHIITDEKISQFNQDNVALLDEFIIYLQSVGRSSGTCEGYINDIQMAWVYNLEKNKNKAFVDWTKKDVMFYQNYCMTVLKVGGSRYRRMRSALSSLSKYIENILDEEYPNFKNIINKIEAPAKNATREKSIWDDEQIQSLLDYLVEKEDYQKACVLSLCWGCGARKTELLRFKVNYFDDKNIIYGSLYKTPEKIVTKGKGGKMLTKYTLKSKIKPYFDLWIEQREKLGIDSEWLFVSKQADGTYEQMHVGSMDYMTEIFSKFLDGNFYWHSMRHNWCTALVKAGIPTSVIKEIGGWESTDMVDLYTDIDIDDKLGDYFSEDGIKAQEKKGLSDL